MDLDFYPPGWPAERVEEWLEWTGPDRAEPWIGKGKVLTRQDIADAIEQAEKGKPDLHRQLDGQFELSPRAKLIPLR